MRPKACRPGVQKSIAHDSYLLGSTALHRDGGAATNAQLTSPNGLAVDAAGNIVRPQRRFDGLGKLYIADSNNNRIRKVAATGAITTAAGSGTLQAGTAMSSPGVSIAVAGN